MSEFFYGWRRKAGCVLLVMALVTTGMWIRSDAVADRVHFAIANRQYACVSLDGCVYWHSTRLGLQRPTFKFRYISKSDPLFHEFLFGLELMTERKSCKYVMYWPVAVPLAVVSAYLILWSGNRKAAKPPQDSTAPESNSSP